MFRQWLFGTLCLLCKSRLTQAIIPSYKRQPEEIKVKLSWVYGIRCDDCKRPLQYARGKQAIFSVGNLNQFRKLNDRFSEEVIYFSACVVIMYNPTLRKQRHYLQHQAPIVSLAICNQSDGNFIASGELADTP